MSVGEGVFRASAGRRLGLVPSTCGEWFSSRYVPRGRQIDGCCVVNTLGERGAWSEYRIYRP